jgi:hypothetical protein
MVIAANMEISSVVFAGMSIKSDGTLKAGGQTMSTATLTAKAHHSAERSVFSGSLSRFADKFIASIMLTSPHQPIAAAAYLASDASCSCSTKRAIQWIIASNNHIRTMRLNKRALGGVIAEFDDRGRSSSSFPPTIASIPTQYQPSTTQRVVVAIVSSAAPGSCGLHFAYGGFPTVKNILVRWWVSGQASVHLWLCYGRGVHSVYFPV